MILRELFYIDKDTKNMSNDMRYEPKRDVTAISKNAFITSLLKWKPIGYIILLLKSVSHSSK